MAAGKKYEVRIWWTGKVKYDQVVDLKFWVRATSNKAAIRDAHDTFKKLINASMINTKKSVQFAVMNEDGRFIESTSVLL